MNSTIVDIRYFPKSSLDENVLKKVKDKEPMLHCKVPAPYYSTFSDLKFDINWQS